MITEHISKALVKHIRSLQQKKFRDEIGLFVAEGAKCVEELQRTFRLVYLVATEEALDGQEKWEAESGTFIASLKEIEQISSLRTPQGMIGVFRKRPEATVPLGRNGLVLALDGIQDPGNMGTIIRTCDWFGIEDIYCSRETADCYNPKVVQATMGALARVHIHYVNLPQWLAALADTPGNEQLPVYGTLLDATDIYHPGAIPDYRRGVIVMGNEGNGISPEVRKFVTHPIRIPSYPKDAETSESLNVSIATAIVLAEFRRLGL